MAFIFNFSALIAFEADFISNSLRVFCEHSCITNKYTYKSSSCAVFFSLSCRPGSEYYHPCHPQRRRAGGGEVDAGDYVAQRRRTVRQHACNKNTRSPFRIQIISFGIVKLKRILLGEYLIFDIGLG